MLRVINYAQISEDVYGDKGKRLPVLYPENYKDIRKTKNGIHRIPEAGINLSPTNDFYAQLYVNFSKGEATDAVVAFRGTAFVHDGFFHPEKDFDNYIVDVESWYKNVLFGNHAETNTPDYMGLATTFYLKARHYIKKHFPEISSSWLNVTGHSLRGSMAALMPSKYFAPAMAVTFNAPGIATVPGVDKRMGGRILSIEARYDFISKIGEHIGKVELVDVPNKETEAKNAFEMNDEINKLTNKKEHTHDPLKQIDLYLQIKEKAVTVDVDFKISFYPQHKMINLLHALEQSSNTKIANQMLFF